MNDCLDCVYNMVTYCELLGDKYNIVENFDSESCPFCNKVKE